METSVFMGYFYHFTALTKNRRQCILKEWYCCRKCPEQFLVFRREIALAKRQDISKVSTKAGEKLPDAELEVLACLWQHREATARQIREIMGDYRPMTHGSMVTLLKRLESKGFVTRSAQPTYRRILRDVVQRIFGGDGVEMVSTFLDTKPPSPRELDQLQRLLDQYRPETSASEDEP